MTEDDVWTLTGYRFGVGGNNESQPRYPGANLSWYIAVDDWAFEPHAAREAATVVESMRRGLTYAHRVDSAPRCNCEQHVLIEAALASVSSEKMEKMRRVERQGTRRAV